MEQGKAIKSKLGQPQVENYVFNTEEKKQLSDFFSVLIQIDRRVNITKSYGKILDK